MEPIAIIMRPTGPQTVYTDLLATLAREAGLPITTLEETAMGHESERWAIGGYAKSYSWAQCRYCGRAQDHDCARVECLLCGSPQCFGNGSGNGRCAICHHGWLPGWSRTHLPRTYTDDGRTVMACGYAGCDDPAIATARKRSVCRKHAERVKVQGQTLTEYVTARIAERDAGKGWQRWKLVA